MLKGFFFGRNGWKSNLDGLGGANSPRLNYICKYIEMFKLIEMALTFFEPSPDPSRISDNVYDNFG